MKIAFGFARASTSNYLHFTNTAAPSDIKASEAFLSEIKHKFILNFDPSILGFGASTLQTEASTYQTEASTYQNEASIYQTEASTYQTEASFYQTEAATYQTEASISQNEAQKSKIRTPRMHLGALKKPTESQL